VYARTSRGPLVPAVLLGVACCALAIASGGIDGGEGATGPGPTAAFLALALGAPAAALAAWTAAPHGAFGSRPTLLALGATAALATWSAASIIWAQAPDLAWIEANRTALALCALVLGTVLATATSRPGAAMAVGIMAAAVPVAVWALASKIAPTLVGPDVAFARLSEPLDYWNALALLVAMALPGALWVAARPGARPIERAASSAAAAAFVVTLVLTYSRGGLLAALVIVGLAVWLMPRRLAMLGVLAAAVAGAVLPLAYGLTAGTLTADRIPAAERRDAGIGLGWRLAVGLAVTAALVLVALRLAPRLRPHGRVLRRVAGVVLLAILIGGGIAAGVRHDAVGAWIGDRIDALGDDTGVGNDPTRFTDPSPNRRLDWWAESGRAFADAPLTGQGAGGFRLTHLAEREPPVSTRENVAQPHQLAMQIAGELGIVGVLLLLALVGAVAWAAVRARRRGADPTIGLAIAIAGGFLVHTQIDWTWSVPGVAVPALLACGAVLAAAGPPRPRRALPAWAAPALAVVALAAAASAFLPWQSARELTAGYSGDAYSHAATARSLNPLSIDPDIFEARVAAAAGDRERALRAARRATEKQPESPRAWRALIAAGATGQEAEEARARIRTLDPLGAQP
jgi:hypothetical protein